jgi:hypothetical protein
MRVFILALDGLSFERVNRWNLKHLKQKQSGFLPSIVNGKHGEPLSPQVWGSFITGIVQDIDDWRVYARPIEWIRWNTPLRHIRGSESVTKTFGKKVLIPLLSFIRLQKKYVERRGLKGTTIFDLIPKSIAVNVPTYNLDLEWLFGYTQKILEGEMDAYEDHVKNNTKLMIQETIRRIPEDWDLFMTWIPIADQMGHVFIKRTKKMRDIYSRLNMLAFNISSRLPEDCIMVIISDHGMRVSSDDVSGCHSPFAFYSFSREVKLRPRRITDFYDLIGAWANQGARISAKRVETLSPQLTS